MGQICGPTTPTFTVNLTGQPNGIYTSPMVQRDDTCCGSSSPDRCVQFIVTLDSAAVGMIFSVCNGAIPPGALFYQVNCGPPRPVGSGICVSPPYPVTITFCKPGSNQNQYCIQSIAPPTVVSLSRNCKALMWTFGYLESTITWNSIFPGPFGAYNNYLGCQSGCDSTWVSPLSGYPPYIDYQVCGTTISGCAQNFCDTVRVNFPPPLTTSVVPTNVSCFGANNGSATAITSGGTAPYTYSWSTIPPQYAATATGLAAGTYSVTLIDSAGCITTNTVVIISPTGLTLNPPLVTNVNCYGNSTGAASVSASGGTAPYSYSWNPGGQTTSTATGLAAGIYTVTVTDNNGCVINSLLQVTQPQLLTSVIISQSNVSCFGGNNGYAAVAASGGTYNYTYLWSNNQTTAMAIGLQAGNYSVVVTDARGCTTTNTVTIIQPPAPLTTSVSSTGISCFGWNDGSAGVIANGATPSYSYQWSTIPVQTTQNVTGLYAGVYTVTVTDALGCTASNTVSITSPTGLTVLPPSVTHVDCFGNSTGSATLTASGGVSPYTYLWSPAGQTSSTATGLPAGVYTITITDNNGCIINTLVQISQPPAPLGSALIYQTNILCFGNSSGSAMVSAYGGTPGYTYHWSNNQTTFNVTGLAAGNYSVLITDANGCTNTLSVTITQPAAALSTTASSVNIGCFGALTGSAAVSATGGTGLYTYVWNPMAPNQPSLSGLSAGNYTCTVYDANGCSVINAFSLTQPSLLTVAVAGTPTVCSGQGTTLTAGVQGGSPGYSYSWNPSSATTNLIFVSPSSTATYSLLVTDANGCTATATQAVTVFARPVADFSAPATCLNNATPFTDQSAGGGTIWSWNFGEPSSGPNNVSGIQNPAHTYGTAGTFSVTLIAYTPNGCSDTSVKAVTVNPLPNISFSSGTVCFGAITAFSNASFIVSGTITQWAWIFGDPNSGSGNISASQNPSHLFTSAGTFNVILTATSDSACQSSLTLPVTVFPIPTASFVPSGACTNTPVYFADASSLAAQWFWDFGNFSGASIAQNPNYTYPSQGSYVVSLIVTSAGGCKDTAFDTLTVLPSPVPNFMPDSVCVSFPTSFTDLTIAPGGSVVEWLWNFGDGSPPDTVQHPMHTYGVSGVYTVSMTATSSNGCKNTVVKTVIVFPQPRARFIYTPGTCIDMGEEIVFTDNSYSNITNWYWNFGDSSSIVYVQDPFHVYNDTGNFTVTLIVQDIHGCMDTTQASMCVRAWTFYIPNAFTPNGNGKNDLFFGEGIGILEYEMWIFDRWGNLIFNCHVDDLPQSLPCQWDGRVMLGPGETIVQEDVYVWKVKLTNILKDVHNYIGTVTVVK